MLDIVFRLYDVNFINNVRGISSDDQHNKIIDILFYRIGIGHPFAKSDILNEIQFYQCPICK